MNLSQEIQTLQERLERRSAGGGLNGGGPEEAAAAAASLYRLVAAHPAGGGLTLMARELQAAWARDILTVRKAGGGGHPGVGGLQEKKMYNIECNPKLCAGSCFLLARTSSIYIETAAESCFLLARTSSRYIDSSRESCFLLARASRTYLEDSRWPHTAGVYVSIFNAYLQEGKVLFANKQYV
jgi:hypothetical protein